MPNIQNYTNCKMIKTTGVLIILISIFCIWPIKAINAQTEITLESYTVISEFPKGIRFNVITRAQTNITEIKIRFTKGSSTTSSYGYLEFKESTDVNGEYFLRTNTGSTYVPPGTPIIYNFEITDSKGNILITEPQVFIYKDTRFDWKEITDGPITVLFHGPIETRATLVASAMIETLDNMGTILGADTTEPIRVNLYNNSIEMLKALPPRSETIRTKLVTEGMAFPDIGMLLVLGSGTRTKGTASHELTHILVHRATKGSFLPIPAWLNEGLAEYGNIDPGTSYDLALEFAIATNKLQPILYLDTQPSTPEDVIIFYGQGRSIVKFLVTMFGSVKIKELMAELNTGKSIDTSMRNIYGFDRQGLDRQWRDWIGAPPSNSPIKSPSRPTPPPLPTLRPYNLTPYPSSSPEEINTLSPTSTIKAIINTSNTSSRSGGTCSTPMDQSHTPIDPSLIFISLGTIWFVFRGKKR